MMCDCCNKKQAKVKDYRFIDSVGFQGKCFMCKDCVVLNDVAVVEIINNR